MNRKFFAFMFLFIAGLSLSSCLSSDDNSNIEYSHDTAVTAFSLGTMTRYYSAKSTSTGNDTVLSAEVTGTNYTFYIDQTTRQIYNVDSLPMGTRVSAVLATITAKESSPMVWMKENVDSVEAVYSSSDSVDFSNPRKLRVYSNDGTAYATYTVTVNVHKELADSFQWHSLASQNAQIAALQDLRGLAVNSNAYIFGTDGNHLKIYKSALSDGKTWTEVTPNVTFSKNAYRDVVTLGEIIYILSDGIVYQSDDAMEWKPLGTNTSLTRLVGASSKYLYGYTQNGISVSKDNGLTWQKEILDAAVDSLPTQSITMNVTGILSTKNAENVLLLGVHEQNDTHNDSLAVLWIRTLDYGDTQEGQWNYVDYDSNQYGKLPYASQVLVAANDSGYVALTSNGNWYKSINGGLTWTIDDNVVLPTEFVASERFAFFRDQNNFYWLVNTKTGSVWKGRYNREGWRRK